MGQIHARSVTRTPFRTVSPRTSVNKRSKLLFRTFLALSARKSSHNPRTMRWGTIVVSTFSTWKDVMERRILFVEDDANFRKVFTRLLREALAPEQLDVAFVEVGSASEARARLREGGLDAALIDVTLPDGNGLDLVGEIHDGGPGDHIPTLVLTASLETSVVGRAMEAGARGALSKLVSMPEAVKAIERLFDAPIEEQR